MTPDRALELAETALHEKRSHAKHHGSPQLERECEEALLLLSDIRSRMLSSHLRRASESLREVKEGQPTAEPSESLRRRPTQSADAFTCDCGYWQLNSPCPRCELP